MEAWKIIDGKLTREFEFKNFKEAINFTNAVAEIAEANNHHPDIFIHSYRKVKIILFTHSAQEITEKDKNLATMIDKIEK